MNPTDKKIPPIFFGGKMDLKVDFEISLMPTFESMKVRHLHLHHH
jgi:hypothetical protein